MKDKAGTFLESARKIGDIDPERFAEDLVKEVSSRLRVDAALCGLELRPFLVGAPESALRDSALLLASYAQLGLVPANGIGFAYDAIKQIASLDHLQLPLERHPWDAQPDDPETLEDTAPEHLSPVACDAHLVLLASLCRLALLPNGGLHGGGPHPVSAGRLAAAGGVTPAAVRLLVSRGRLRRWRRGVVDQRLYVHPEDARVWLEARGPKKLVKNSFYGRMGLP